MIIPPTNLVELLNIPARDYVIYARDLFLYEKKKKRPTKKKEKKKERGMKFDEEFALCAMAILLSSRCSSSRRR